LSRSRKYKQKQNLLDLVNKKSFSSNWEERYVSMYALSRYMWRSGKFEDLKETYSNVLRLLEDQDGRVGVAARNALEHFRSFFTMHAFGGYSHFNEKEIVNLWIDSLFLLWDKTKNMEEGKKQYRMMRCVKTLFRTDMEAYLTRPQLKKYDEIWDKIQELNELYNEFGWEE
jgi:hypothetical protein